MSFSQEMLFLINKWKSGNSWPKFLKWIEIKKIHGWTGERVEFDFPIVAIVGENGSGKSTILQAIAASYNDKDIKTFASTFFPNTAWDKICNAEISFEYKEGKNIKQNSIKKISDRWRGYKERPLRKIHYIDLRRAQPIIARSGYIKIAKSKANEASAELFSEEQTKSLSSILGKNYSLAKISVTDIDKARTIPVLQCSQNNYSGFHQGAGEIIMAELISNQLEKYSILLIDEIESSLHPRAQRNLIRYFAKVCRTKEIQLVLTTHSPYILAEIPEEGRCYISQTPEGKNILKGVSTEFAMSKMDDENYPECEIYIEDDFSKVFLEKIISSVNYELTQRLAFVSFGAASVGKQLGIMVKQNRFLRKTLVFLDGDQDSAEGCHILPGGNCPEYIVFNSLKELKPYPWKGVEEKIEREYVDVADNLERAMLEPDVHILG